MRAALSIVLAAAVGVSLWVLWARVGPPLPELASGVEPTDLQRSDEAQAAEPSAAPPLASATSPRVSLEPAGPELTIRVVRHGSEQPIEGAEVGYAAKRDIDWPKLDHAEAQSLRRRDIEFFRSRDQVRITAATGECRVPWTEGGMMLTGRVGALFSSVDVGDEQDEPLTLRLRPDHRLRVRVRDAAGHPAAGALVAMQVADAAPSRRLGMTNQKGALTIEHTQRFAGEATSCPVQIHAEGHGISSESVALDLLRTPESTVDLTLPPAGTITFELVRATGEPVDLTDVEPPSLTLSIHTEPPSGHEGGHTGPLATFDPQGRAVVSHIALDHYVAASVWAYVSDPVIALGPTAGRPNLTVPLVVADDQVVLCGRALGPGGQPLVRHYLRLEVRHENGRSSLTATTNDDARFALPVPAAEPGTELQIAVREGPRGKHDTVPAATSLAEPWAARAGINDLGDLTLREPPLLLSGRLVVPDALANLEQIGWRCQRTRRGSAWPTQEFSTRWLGGRRFEIRGDYRDEASLWLHFDSGDYLPMTPLEFVPGTEGLEIELRAAGQISASALVDDTEFAPQLRVSMVALHPTQPPSRRERTRREARDRRALRANKPGRLEARWRDLEPGRYRLTLECPGAHAPLAVVDDIVVEGGPVEDPRLVDIDLRARLRTVAIRLEGPDGAPVTSKDALVLITDPAGGHRYGQHLQDGIASVLIADRVDLRVLAPGFRATDVHGVTADRVVRLDVLPEVRVRVAWPYALPPGAHPKLRLLPASLDGIFNRRIDAPRGSRSIKPGACAEATIDEDGIATLRPLALGETKLRLAMGPSGAYEVRALTPRTIDVGDASPPEIVVHVDPDRLRRTLEMMADK